ncbi:hypothetical protein ETB97_007356 [Aspergillus alliaceus]|uniref:Benzoate 4-monooxygenase cytochrome P450 n=1 Tax=Petromyces alliaceus TaxID=209559 RepID=A0A8H6E9I2_PETAA|nr:hypothetical protein ETB97_007356 [Aspergillus burnettii]
MIITMAVASQIPALEPLPLLACVSLIVLVLPMWWSLYNIYLHPLRKYPGPRLAASSSLYYYRWSYGGNLHAVIKQLHDQYGDVVRISPNMLVYRNPQAWKDICGHRKNGAAPFIKDQEFYSESPVGHHLVSTPNEADHSRIRRLLSHAFSDRALKEQEPLLQSYVDLLVSRLHEFGASPSQKPIDMTSWYNYTTFDIIGDLAFGESFNCLQSRDYHPWVKTVFPTLKSATFIRPLLIFPSQIAAMLIPQWLKEMREEAFNLASEKVRRRLSLETTRPDFITYILRHSGERGMNLSEIQANAGLLIIAGSETTATLLSGCTFYLLTHPIAYKKLVTEIREAFQQESDITFLSIAKLRYLHAVLEESLRMYPPVSAILPRKVPMDGALINGQFVPGGTSVSMAYYSAFRASSNFTDPDSFIPERWLDDKDPRFETDKKEVLQPFSYGPRNCLGKNLAYSELRLIVVRLFWNFDMTLAGGGDNWTDQLAYTVWEKKPLMVKLSAIHR